MNRQRLIEVARGDAPADLLLRNARLVNVLSGEIHTTDVAVAGEWIVGLGEGYKARETVDLAGAYLAPGFIDAHMHIESTMLTPPELARVVLPHGTTAVITDPHEIANVRGIPGVRFMLEAGRQAPIDVFVMVPSCVPATHMETAGATLDAADMASLINEPNVLGVAELMNYPGVIHAAPDVLAKLEVAGDKRVDGHAPGVSGQALNAYIAAGIRSDHECTTLEEAREKLRRGMHILIREGSTARNLKDLLPLVTPQNAHRCMFVTDDITPPDLMKYGHIDNLLRMAVDQGLDPVVAVQMATLSPTRYFGLRDRGAVAPGRRADLVVLEDLREFRVRQVYYGGRLVAADGQMVIEPPPLVAAEAVRGTMNPAPFRSDDFAIPAQGERVRVIGVIPNQIVTRGLVREAVLRDGHAVADPSQDLLKLAVIERHRASGAIGLGFLEGFGLQRGAVAGSVAHDHHNLLVAGASDEDMFVAAQAVVEMDGGLAVAADGQIAARLPLPIGGLMSDRPGPEVRDGYEAVTRAARDLGCPLDDPFMALSFLALEVIPELKLTDQGLVDVTRFQIVPLFVE